MDASRITIIKTDDQYRQYCTRLETLLFEAPAGPDSTDDIELLTLLIGKWDAEHSPLPEQDPISLLKTLLAAHRLNGKDLSELLGVSKGLVSDILHYKRGLSKEVIRKLAARFSVSQEAFNRPYPLVSEANSHLRDAKVMNTRKELEPA
jgi:HTH-type transcriptional regulator/antitoxin HigA